MKITHPPKLLRKSQGSFDFGNGHANHKAYDRRTASGKLVHVEQKGVQSQQEAPAKGKHHDAIASRMKELDARPKAELVALVKRHHRVVSTNDMDKTSARNMILEAEFGRKALLAYDAHNEATKTKRAKPDEAKPAEKIDRRQLQSLIEQHAAEQGKTKIELTSKLQAGAAAAGREELVAMLGVVKNRFIRQQATYDEHRQEAERLGQYADENWLPGDLDDAAAAHRLAGQHAQDDAARSYHEQKTAEYESQAEESRRAGDVEEEPATPPAAAEPDGPAWDHHGIEAYGQRGMDNRSWRKTFKDSEALVDWADRNGASVIGTRALESYEQHQHSKGAKDRASGSSKVAAGELKRILESSDFGFTEAGGNGRVKANADGTITVYDGYFYGGREAEERHNQKWSTGGDYHKYFAEQGFDINVVDHGSNMKSKVMSGRGGDVWVKLAVSKANIAKSHVRAHTRKTKAGSVVQIHDYDDARVKKIVVAEDKWTPSETSDKHHFRFSTKRGIKVLFRKTIDPAAYGGYKIHSVGHPSRLSKEWIDGHFKA